MSLTRITSGVVSSNAISAEKLEEEVPENVRVMDIGVTELKDMFSRYSYVY